MKMKEIPDNNKPNINAIYIFTLSLRGAERRGNLNLFSGDCFVPVGFAMTSEGIFFAPRDDTGIIAFVLVNRKKLLNHH